MHLEDEDVKIWNGDGEDEDGDVKIWNRPLGAELGKKLVRQPQEEDGDDADEEAPRRRKAERRAYRHDREVTGGNITQVVISAALFAASWYLPAEGWYRIVCLGLAFLVVGIDVLLDAVAGLITGQLLSDSLVIFLASVTAFAIGRTPQAVLVVMLFRVGKLFEGFAESKSKAAVDALYDICPDSANVETAEGVLTVSPDYVNIDDIIVVAPGERIALDGVVEEGISTVDAQALTGDGEPRAVSVGSPVYAGTANVTAMLRVRVRRSYADSTANRVLDLMDQAEGKPSRHELFAQRFGRFYTPVMAAAALLLALVPPIFDAQWTEWIGRGVILLVAACPNAVSVSVPLSYLGGLGRATRRGILVKGPCYLEAFAKTDTMVFDKTGTITEGRFTVTDVFPVGMSEHKLLAIAATAESHSKHPIARCLREASGAIRETDARALQVEEVPGRGVVARLGGRRIYVGNAALLEENGISFNVPSRSGAAIHVAMDGSYCGHILIADKIREGAFDAMETLRVQGVKKLVMLTGDVLSVARPIASRLNFEMLRAELTPEEKISALEYLIQNRGENAAVSFVGDGISDSGVLDKADVGVAMGALGYDEAIRWADIVLMDDDIRKLPEAMGIAKRSAGISRENIIVALTQKLAVILLGASGLISVSVAAALDVGVLIAAILNSMRNLMKRKAPEGKKAMRL